MTHPAKKMKRRMAGKGAKNLAEGNKQQIYKKKLKKGRNFCRRTLKILRRKLCFHRKPLGIICAKGAFHFWEIGVIIVTSYRGHAHMANSLHVIQNSRNE